jgi:hypothetical protein
MEPTQQVTPTDGEQKVEEKSRLQRLQKVWKSRIEKEEKAHKNMRDRARSVQAIYDGGNKNEDPVYVPLYWTVCNVQHVGVYSSQPVPDVRPRNEEDNPTYRNIARMIQRGLSYCVDDQSFDNTFHRTVDDYLSVALGVPRVKIDSIIETEEIGKDFFNQPVTEEKVGDQTLRWEYVPWARFGWQPCNLWKHVTWEYFRHRMTQSQIRERFGKTAKASKDDKDKKGTDSWMNNTFDIYEIWDKKAQKVIFFAKGESEPLQIVDDPLSLKGFFPNPEPMMMNIPSEELIPKPDYNYIEYYDMELNRLQERRMNLLEQIKSSGAYDKGLPELGGMLDLDDGEMLPIQNLMGRMAAVGGTENMIYWLPIKEKVETLMQLTQQIQFVKSQVDEILGISDIVMGVTKASESATAQDIKGRWVGIRLSRKRECVQYTIREMMRIMAQLLGSHITPENLQRMTQMQMTEEMMQIFKSDTLMDFIVDIETESTVAKDEVEERRAHQEMLNGVAQFAQAVLPMVQQNMLDADVSSAILATAMKPYARYSRSLDEALTKLPTNTQQLQKLNQEKQQTEQQLQQVTQQMEQWQTMAQKLQMEATQAKNANLGADTQKKTAETAKIRAEIGNDSVEPLKTAAEVGKIRAETFQIAKGKPNAGGQR